MNVSSAIIRLLRRSELPVHIFLLSGIYGPGRSALDTVRRVNGDLSQCGADDQLVISRIHIDDVLQILTTSMANPRASLRVNVADDLPASRYDVTSLAHLSIFY